LGLCYFELGRPGESLRCLEKAEEMHGENIAGIYFHMGNCCQELNEYNTALSNYKKSLNVRCPSEETLKSAVLCQIGSCYVKLKEYDNAINALLEALKIDTGSWNMYNLIGVAYRETGKYDDAVAALKKSVELNPREWRNYNVLGNTYIKAGMAKEGVEQLEKALQLCDEGQYRNNIEANIESAKKQIK